MALDFLIKKNIIKNKIGFIGHSYGARMAVFFPAYDKRVKASVSNCWCLNYKNSLKKEFKTKFLWKWWCPIYLIIVTMAILLN